MSWWVGHPFAVRAALRPGTYPYLVEAKWSGSSEVRDGRIELRPEQTLRHKIFAAYLEAWWNGGGNEAWSVFRDRHRGGLPVGTERYPIPKAGTRLAANLKAVLGVLGGPRRKVVNLLLYLALEGEGKLPTGKPDDFDLVVIQTKSRGGFVELPVMAT